MYFFLFIRYTELIFKLMITHLSK